MILQSLDKEDNMWVMVFQALDNPLFTYTIKSPKIKHGLSIIFDLETLKYLYEEL